MPILLSSKVGSSGHQLFSLLNAWCDHPDMYIVVNEKWDSSRATIWNFWGRIKAIRDAVQRWQGDQFSHNENWIRECEEAL